MDAEALYLADGATYDGPTFTDPKGRAFGEVNVPCPSCRGRGQGLRGGRCRRCSGDRVVFEQALVYTGEELRKKNARAQRRRVGKMDAERDRLERIASNHRDCVDQHPEVYEGAKRWPNDRFIADLVQKSEKFGGLTEAQIAALRTAVSRNDEDLQHYSASVAVAREGDRVELEAVCHRVVHFVRDKLHGGGRESAWFVEMDDGKGNAVVAVTAAAELEVGQAVRISGTVKGVDDARGWTRTLLSHLKILELVPAAAPKQGLN